MAFIYDNVGQEMRTERTDLVVVDLLEIIDDAIATVRIANCRDNITTVDGTYTSKFFNLARGAEGIAPGEATITIYDTDQVVFQALESIPPVSDTTTTIRFLLYVDDDETPVQIDEEYELRAYEVDELGTLTLTVLTDPYLGVEIPMHSITPDVYPGVFKTLKVD